MSVCIFKPVYCGGWKRKESVASFLLLSPSDVFHLFCSTKINYNHFLDINLKKREIRIS